MDEESAEAKQERLLNEQFEKEEWKKLRKHIIDSDDSKNLMQAIIEVKDRRYNRVAICTYMDENRSGKTTRKQGLSLFPSLSSSLSLSGQFRFSLLT